MQQQAASRKRPAPGTSPMLQQPTPPMQPAYQFPQQMPENSDYSSFDFSQPLASDQAFSDPSLTADTNNFSSYLQNNAQPTTYPVSSLATTQTAPSTDLVRRARNQQLAPHRGSGVQEQWNGGAYGSNMGAQGTHEEDERELEQKVQLARKEAQNKRKQIPPFVQKLSSFLDSNNTELIRWSDDGRSFIVLDEDEFARTLIPELFKHNNYASFVRQLNMYGFHKTVNITDGSLRQSEKARKGVKPPSMYSHPYFRKNIPDLLWLIQKPTAKAGAKRKRDGVLKEHFDSDDERQFSPMPGGPPAEVGAAGSANQDLAHLPRNEMASLRRELQQLQHQQRFISQMITQLKEQNDQFYRQATAFQQMHDRHENSINAILTFLATFYNRSLEGHGAQNLVNMFNSAGQPQQPADSRVVEEFKDGASDLSEQLRRFAKKPQLLLPGPVADLQQRDKHPRSPGNAVTANTSARTSASPPNAVTGRTASSSAPPHENVRESTGTASPIIKDDAPTPNVLQQVPENDEMMSLINNINSTNASSTPGTAAPAFDFGNALNHYQTANGNAPLTPQQRDNMLALIANHHGNDGGQNNALMTPQAPTMPDMNQLKETQQQLEMLTNMQKRQDQKVQELNKRLQPLSPTGSIPGLAHGEENPMDFIGAPGDYDPSAFINFDDANGWNDPGPMGDNGNFDFDFNAAGASDADINWDFGSAGAVGDDMFNTNDTTQASVQDGGGRVESVSSTATSPADTAVEQVAEADGGAARKRMRQST